MIENINGEKVFKIPCLDMGANNSVDYVYDEDGKIKYENFADSELLDLFLFTKLSYKDYEHPIHNFINQFFNLDLDSFEKTRAFAKKLFCNNPQAENIANVILEAALYYLDHPIEDKVKIYDETNIISFLSLVAKSQSQNQNLPAGDIKLKGKLLQSLFEKISNNWFSRYKVSPDSFRTLRYGVIAFHLYKRCDSFCPNLFKCIVNVFIRGLNFVLPKSWELNYLDCYVPLTSLELDKIMEDFIPDARQTSNNGKDINLEERVENAVNRVNTNNSLTQAGTIRNSSKSPNIE